MEHGSLPSDRGSSLPAARPPVDAAIVPGLLLLVGRDLLVQDPPRVLAWRLLHDPSLAAVPSWLAPLVPRPAGGLDRDPVALALAALAVAFAAAYLLTALAGARARWRGAILGLAALVLVGAPTAAFVGIGVTTHRPYGQDGGVVQLPLALDKILAGQSPYGADYSDSILGKESRVSSFWAPYGGNPILRHHAYLPGTHLVMMPFYLLSKALVGVFDPRAVTLLAFALAAVLAARLLRPRGAEAALAGASLVLLNPLVYWPQIFGAGDLVFVAPLLLAAVLGRRRPLAAGAALGLACATKQLAWPFAPFLLLHLSEAGGLADFKHPEVRRRLLRPALVALGVFALVVAPVALLDPKAFWGDIVVYNVGLPGGDSYPLGGTPGIGFANFLIYFGVVRTLRAWFPFGIFYLLLIPLGVLLVLRQLRENDLGTALLTGGTALFASLYLSRVVHPNYFLAAAILIPIGVLAGRRRADLALVPLGLLMLAVEFAENEPLRTLWEQVAPFDRTSQLSVLLGPLAPRFAPGTTVDPFGLLISASLAGLALAYLVLAVLGVPARARTGAATLLAVTAVAAPTALVVALGARTGFVRAESEWVVQVRADARRLSRAESPYRPPPEPGPVAREAWSTSFRKEPPRVLAPQVSRLAPGAALAELVAGGPDPRVLGLVALLGLLALLAGSSLGPERPAAIGLVGLAPPLVMGAVWGAGALLPTVVLAAAFLVSPLRRPRLAGALAGAAGALDFLGLAVVPFVLIAAGRGWRRAAAVAPLVFALAVLPVVALAPAAFLRALPGPGPEPGVGLLNLGLYAGARGSIWLIRLLLAMGLVLGLAALARSGRLAPAGAGAVAALGALLLSSGRSPESLALPLVLAGLTLLLPLTAGSTAQC